MRSSSAIYGLLPLAGFLSTTLAQAFVYQDYDVNNFEPYTPKQNNAAAPASGPSSSSVSGTLATTISAATATVSSSSASSSVPPSSSSSQSLVITSAPSSAPSSSSTSSGPSSSAPIVDPVGSGIPITDNNKQMVYNYYSTRLFQDNTYNIVLNDGNSATNTQATCNINVVTAKVGVKVPCSIPTYQIEVFYRDNPSDPNAEHVVTFIFEHAIDYSKAKNPPAGFSGVMIHEKIVYTVCSDAACSSISYSSADDTAYPAPKGYKGDPASG